MTRDYSKLNLPVTVSHWELGMVLEQIRPYWNQIPAKIETSFVAAYDGGTDWTVTEADLDLLPDSLWSILEAKLAEI